MHWDTIQCNVVLLMGLFRLPTSVWITGSASSSSVVIVEQIKNCEVHIEVSEW
jgi:hypothetical protein